jgi:hypothetical protein
MLEVTVDPQVLTALKKAFPKPTNSAQRALTKYVTTFKNMLIDSLSRGQSIYESHFNLFTISLHDLANKGGQIGSKKVRVHAWLRDNGLALVRSIEIGSNLTGTLSKATPSTLIKVEWHEPEVADDQIDVDGLVLDKTLFEGKADSNAEIYNTLFHDYEELAAAGTAHEVFDTTDVDIKSLTNYVKWLRKKPKHLKLNQVDSQILQARVVLAIAKHTNGKFLQRKKPSNFGRMYYSGTSIQNVSKELRRAMLGDCWEYDIRSSVVAWKMGFAEEWVKRHRPHSTVDKEFVCTKWYLDNKDQFIKHVQHVVFGNNGNHTVKFQLKLLKQAFTALSFGARKTGKSWKNENGKWVPSALVDILKIKDERERFCADQNVNGFIKEQKSLDTFLFEVVKASHPDLLTLPYLQTKGRRTSQPKVVAFLYQHEETTVMNIVRDSLPATHQPPLANIHDAIILKQRLTPYEKEKIEWRMRSDTRNRYWRLGQTELKRWESNLDWADVL